MGAVEVAALTVAAQVTKGVAVFCNKAVGVTTNPTGKIAYQVGAQVANNLWQLAVYGLNAANPEFAAVNTAEKGFVAACPTLPPIT